MELGKFSPEHQFFVADLDKDGGPEFIFTDLNVLQVFDYKKQKIAEQRLEPSATKPFLIDLLYLPRSLLGTWLRVLKRHYF